MSFYPLGVMISADECRRSSLDRSIRAAHRLRNTVNPLRDTVQTYNMVANMVSDIEFQYEWLCTFLRYRHIPHPIILNVFTDLEHIIEQQNRLQQLNADLDDAIKSFKLPYIARFELNKFKEVHIMEMIDVINIDRDDPLCEVVLI